MKIFLVEDDLLVGRALLTVLQDEGNTVVWVRLGADVCARAKEESFDLVLLDLGLPDIDGIALLRVLRAQNAALPVIILSSRDSLEDRLRGFHGGADDYLVKPFDIPELLARLHAVTRRTRGADTSLWSHADLVLDQGRMLVTRAGAPVALSKTEFALLAALMRQPDRVLTRAELEQGVLPGGEGHTLDVHMSNLRRKIGDGYVRTVRGVGYMVRHAPG
jgi:two-component system response regulator QseB